MADALPTLAESVMDTSTGRRVGAKLILEQMDEAGVRGVPISPELAEAVPVIAAKFLTSGKPRMMLHGAKLIQAALRYNLNRWDSATGSHATQINLSQTNVTHTIKVEFDNAG